MGGLLLEGLGPRRLVHHGLGPRRLVLDPLLTLGARQLHPAIPLGRLAYPIGGLVLGAGNLPLVALADLRDVGDVVLADMAVRVGGLTRVRVRVGEARPLPLTEHGVRHALVPAVVAWAAGSPTATASQGGRQHPDRRDDALHDAETVYRGTGGHLAAPGVVCSTS